MKESVIYQDILQKGEQSGKKSEAFHLVSRLLNRKFGEIDSSTIERIRVLSTDELEVLAEDLLDFSNTSDLETWLNQHS
jgi:predicted transposase YdaD